MAELIYRFVVDSVDVTEYVLGGTKIKLSKTNTAGNTASVIVVNDASGSVTVTIFASSKIRFLV